MLSNGKKIGVILINTGSPASPDPLDIKPYLLEFLSDPNLVKIPHVVWLPILKNFVLRTRPKKTSPRYKLIWTNDGSPLLLNSFAQRDALNRRFAQAGMDTVCECGMRYGTPSIDEAMSALEKQGCRCLVALPLFPQTAFCTVKTCKEKALSLAAMHPKSKVSVIEGYSNNAVYLNALTNSIAEVWQYKQNSKLLFSFHSVPLSDVEEGDVYLHQVNRCILEVTRCLGIDKNDYAIAYHSRFEDSRAWVAPHPKTVLAKWVDEGASRVAIVAPGFAAECLETLYDVDIVEREYFNELCASHKLKPDFTYIPALNTRPDHIDALFDVVTKHYKTLEEKEL